jgi:hypothetical protein
MDVKLLTNGQSEIKKISVKKLKKLSDSNFGKLNRNIDVDVLEKDYKVKKFHKVELQTILIHHHFMGKLTKPHYRCWVRVQGLNILGFQDVFINQWDELSS